MKFIDSPEVLKAMSDADNQKEILAIIARMGRRNEAMMQSPLETNDSVLNVRKEKLWASSSRAVQDEVKNLPDWYITEDEVDIDMSVIIGFGGDAKIYRGVLEDGTPVAVKVFNRNVQRSEKAKQKFFNTMQLWVRLSHFNNVCRLYGACYFTATPFIAMEYCDLGSLDTYLRQEGVDRCKASIEILTQAARAVIKMHSKGFVHGDLKCDNILVTGDANPQAKLCDFDRSFDWSALKDERLVNGTAVDAGIEITDAVRYLAPECVEGMLPNSKSDVYSFGMTLYHALTGASPYFDITSDKELRACKLARELPSRSEQCIGEDAWKIISQCCGPSAEQRPTMEKVLEALKLLASQLPAITTLLNAAIGVQADQINVLIPTLHADGTPVKSSTKAPSRVNPRSFKIVVAVILGLAAAGIAIGIVVGMKSSSSASSNDSSTGSGLESINDSSTGSNLSSSAGSDSSSAVPTPTSTTSTVSGVQVTTIFTLDEEGSHNLWGVAVTSDGKVYLGDTFAVYQVTNEDKNPTVYAGSPDDYGDQDGGLLAARFGGRMGPFALGPNGDLFICDDGNYKVRQIAGTNVGSFSSFIADGYMMGIGTDSSGNVYVTDDSGVRRITSAGSISMFANSTVSSPRGIAIDSSDNVYVTDNHRVLKFSPAGAMSVVAGSATGGSVNAMGESARFREPRALAFGSDGDLYVADSGNNCIRKISLATSEVSTYAGTCSLTGSTKDGSAASAKFYVPKGIAATADNVFYVTDGLRLRKIYTV